MEVSIKLHLPVALRLGKDLSFIGLEYGWIRRGGTVGLDVLVNSRIGRGGKHSDWT